MSRLNRLAWAASLAILLFAPTQLGIVQKAFAQDAAKQEHVAGAHVDVVAQWNESKSAQGRYQAPANYRIKYATPVVSSALRASHSVLISSDRREAVLNVQVRGKNEFWNKERGWFTGHLDIGLEPAM